MNKLVHIKAKLRNLDQVYQIMSWALWDKIGQIWPEVAYYDPIYIVMPRYDQSWLYLPLFYQFWSILPHFIMFGHI